MSEPERLIELFDQTWPQDKVRPWRRDIQLRAQQCFGHKGIIKENSKLRQERMYQPWIGFLLGTARTLVPTAETNSNQTKITVVLQQHDNNISCEVRGRSSLACLTAEQSTSPAAVCTTTLAAGADISAPIPPDPQTEADCKKGGWEFYGFRNQGQCIRYVTTGKDSR